MKLSSYVWILFDMDETLLDFHSTSLQSFTALCQEMNWSNLMALHDSYALINQGIWGEFERGELTALTLRTARFERFLTANQLEGDSQWMSDRYLAGLVQYSTLKSGAMTLLQQLHGHYQLGIITNGLKEVQRPRLKKMQIEHFFDTIIVSDEIGVSKPNWTYFAQTHAAIGAVDKDKVLVIGDSLRSDIAGAQQYGFDTCWINPTGLNYEGEQIPNGIIAGVADLI